MTAAGLSGAGIQHANAGNQLNITSFATRTVSARVTNQARTFRYPAAIDGTSSTINARVGIASVGDASASNIHKSIVAGVAAETGVTDLAMALVRTNKIRTIGMAEARVGRTLVNVRAHKTVALIAHIALTDETAVRVSTAGIGVAGIGQALVNVRASQAIRFVAFKTFARSFGGGSIQLTDAVPRAMLVQAGIEHAGHIVQTRISLIAGLAELTGVPFFGTVTSEFFTIRNALAREAGIRITRIRNLLRDAGAFQ